MRVGSLIREARRERGLSTHQLARLARIPQSAIHRIEAEDTHTSKHIPILLRVLDITPATPHPAPSPQVISLMGTVGIAGEIIPQSNGNYIEIPVGLAGPGIAAVEVTGDDMFPVYQHGDIIYYNSPEAPGKLVGRDAVIKLKDGRYMLKQLYAGRTPNLWTLFFFNRVPILDVELEWAARIRWVQKA